MSLEKIEIRPSEKDKRFFHCVLYSTPTVIGSQKLEIVCSKSALRQVRNAINQALEEDERTQHEQEFDGRIGRPSDYKKY